MIGFLCFVVAVLASPIKAKIRLEAENAALRHQLVVLRRKATIVIVFALSAAIAFMHTLVYFSIDPHGLSAQMPSGDLKRYNADRGTLLVGNRY